MKYKIISLIPINTWLKFRIWFICSFFPNLLKNERTSNIKNGWELTFIDDFDIYNDKIWQDYPYFGHRYHPGNIVDKGIEPFQYFDYNCISVENSILKLKCELNPIEIEHIDWDGVNYGKYTIPYRLGWIQTMPNTFEQRHGYFEIRSKSPNSGGCWPAFWLASTISWPPEIDIFEIYTSDGQKRSTSTIHWGKEPNHPSTGFGYRTVNLNDDFGVWGCEWNKNQIKIYYNSWLVKIFPTPEDFIYPMNIIINNAVQTDESGKNRNEIESPNYFEIDYVKVWKRS
jgi:beta-glucanase (GH16 family)